MKFHQKLFPILLILLAITFFIACCCGGEEDSSNDGQETGENVASAITSRDTGVQANLPAGQVTPSCTGEDVFEVSMTSVNTSVGRTYTGTWTFFTCTSQSNLEFYFKKSGGGKIGKGTETVQKGVPYSDSANTDTNETITEFCITSTGGISKTKCS